MKKTAEEFLKERCPLINDPKGVSHFTGDFVISMMEQYAASQPPKKQEDLEYDQEKEDAYWRKQADEQEMEGSYHELPE